MFTLQDLRSFKAFKTIISSGEYAFKGDAVLVAASLFKWFDELGKKIEDDLKPKPELKETSIKELDSVNNS